MGGDRVLPSSARCGACWRWSGFYRFVWHRPLFDLALYVVLLGAVVFSGHRDPGDEDACSVLFLRLVVTLAMVAVAGVVGLALWDYYLDAPWTRDGRVRADVVAIAPDVSGLVTEVLVSDNQNVRRGDVLFRIDPERFTLALRQAEAVVAGKQAAAVQSEKDYERYKQLSDAAVSQQRFELAQATAQEAKAAYDQAVADRDLAKLNLERSAVHASVNGRITNMDLRPGAYVTVGRGVMALIDERHPARRGLFRGDQAAAHSCRMTRRRVRLLGEASALSGRVQSIAGGIEDRERSAGTICSRTSTRPSPGSASPSGSRCASCSIRCRTA